jgi:hypothetical protein
MSVLSQIDRRILIAAVDTVFRSGLGGQPRISSQEIEGVDTPPPPHFWWDVGWGRGDVTRVKNDDIKKLGIAVAGFVIVATWRRKLKSYGSRPDKCCHHQQYCCYAIRNWGSIMCNSPTPQKFTLWRKIRLI